MNIECGYSPVEYAKKLIGCHNDWLNRKKILDSARLNIYALGTHSARGKVAVMEIVFAFRLLGWDVRNVAMKSHEEQRFIIVGVNSEDTNRVTVSNKIYMGASAPEPCAMIGNRSYFWSDSVETYL